MIPLTVLSGMPIVACICASGEMKFGCRRIAARTIQFAPTQAQPSCCQKHVPSPRSTDETAASSRCCQGVVELPSPIVSAERISAPERHAASLPLFAVGQFSAHSSTSLAVDIFARGDLPPPDFVILHHAFLI